MAEMAEEINEFKRRWTLDPRDFAAPPRLITADVAARDDYVLHMTRTYNALASRIMPTAAPAANRWLSAAPALACLMFVVLICNVGPRGWLLAWPLDEVHRI